MNYNNILFDLDGTLIDSAPGIEESFYQAYLTVYNIECPQKITTLIGPPIDQVLILVNEEKNIDSIKKFVNAFKEHYDKNGYKNSKLYKDVISVLEMLFANNVNMFIATNKRQKPTKKILEHLKISKYFNAIYCPDIFEMHFRNKTELIKHLLKSQSLELSNTIMIGDTMHDGIAAYENNLDFALVEYGYGDYKKYTYSLKSIKELINII